MHQQQQQQQQTLLQNQDKEAAKAQISNNKPKKEFVPFKSSDKGILSPERGGFVIKKNISEYDIQNIQKNTMDPLLRKKLH